MARDEGGRAKAKGGKARRNQRLTGPAPALISAGDTRGPDFICIGAQKAGTRWLFDQLAFHPGFWMPPIKELHYLNGSKRFLRFARPLHERAARSLRSANRRRARAHERPLAAEDIEWLAARMWLHKRPLDLDRYARLFNLRGDRLSGDICPPYAILPEEEVRAVRTRFPQARIVYLVREPVERFWSQYCMILRRHPQDAPESLETVRAFMERGTGPEHSGLRAAIGRWRHGPGDANFGLYFFDELKSDADGLRRRIVGFLGGDPGEWGGTLPADHNRKAAYAKIEMAPDVRDYLVARFADEIRFAAAELGGPAAAWPAKYGL
jgi:Sulfotransferase family